MHDVPLRRMLQSVGHLHGDIHRAGHVERPFRADHVPQVGALDELEDDEVPAVLAADGVDAADVLVVEAGGRLGLVAEPLEHLLVVGLSPGEHLHGDGAMERGVEGAEDRPHATAAHELIEAVGPKHRPLEHPSDLAGRGGTAGDRARGAAAPRSRRLSP